MKMESLDKEELKGYLIKKGMSPDLAARLKEEAIDGDMFLTISADILRACGFKAGEIVTIIKYSNMPFEADGTTNTSTNGSEIISGNVTGNTITDQSNQNMFGDYSNKDGDLGEEGGNDEFLGGLEMAQDAELSEYFSPIQFEEMSRYDRTSMYNQLTRWKRAVEAVGLKKAEHCKPYFVKKSEEAALKLQKKQAKDKKNDSANKENTNPTPSSSRKTSERLQSLVIKTQSNARGSASDELLKTSEEESRRGNLKSQTTFKPVVTPSSSRVSETINNQQRASSSGTQNNLQDDTENSESEPNSTSGEETEEDKEVPFDLSVQLPLSPECLKVESMDSNLPKYDMRKILNEIYLEAKPDLRRAIRLLKNSNKMLPRLQRVRIMRAITLYLFNTISDGKKPTPDMKEGLAKSFVLTFNAYLLPPSNEKKPWSLVFNRNGTGYLASSCRAPEKPFKKKRKMTKKSVPLEAASEYDSDYVKELSVLMPDRSNKNAILDAMANTFSMRNTERLRGLKVYDFIERYPHFASFDGEVLREEFKRLQPTAKDMSAEFTRLLPEMLKLQEKQRIVMDCEDETLRALQLISQNLPHDITRKAGSSWAKLERVVDIMKHGQDLEAYAASKGEPGVPIQPYMIAVKGIIGKRIARNFLVLDRKVMQLPSSTLKAFDTLIKAFFVFNVCYPIGWHNTFHFLATCFYRVFEKTRKRPDAITPSEHELLSKLEGKL